MKFTVGNPIEPQKGKTYIAGGVSEQGKRVSKYEDAYIDTQSLQGEAREKFILEWMGLVKSIAINIANGQPKEVEREDLIQYGVFGLLDAMERYDPSKGFVFSTFAEPRIRGAILDGLRGEDYYGRNTRDKVNKIKGLLKRNENRIMQGLQPLTDEEIAKELEMDVSVYRHYLSIAKLNSVNISLENEDNPEVRNIVDQTTKHPDELAHEEKVREIVQAALGEFLSGVGDKKRRTRFAYIYEQYYIKERTMEEIGEVLGINQSLISRLLIKMKNEIQRILETKGFKAKDIDWINSGFLKGATRKIRVQNSRTK